MPTAPASEKKSSTTIPSYPLEHNATPRRFTTFFSIIIDALVAPKGMVSDESFFRSAFSERAYLISLRHEDGKLPEPPALLQVAHFAPSSRSRPLTVRVGHRCNSCKCDGVRWGARPCAIYLLQNRASNGDKRGCVQYVDRYRGGGGARTL